MSIDCIFPFAGKPVTQPVSIVKIARINEQQVRTACFGLLTHVRCERSICAPVAGIVWLRGRGLGVACIPAMYIGRVEKIELQTPRASDNTGH